MSRYLISTYEGYDGDWTPYATALSAWAIRGVLRQLQALGYERDCSIMVEALADDGCGEHEQMTLFDVEPVPFVNGMASTWIGICPECLALAPG